MILLNFKKQIKGNSTVKGHENWIVLDSVDFRVSRHISHSANGVDRNPSAPTFSAIACNKTCDIASTELFIQSVCGVSLEEAQLHFMQTDGKDSDQVYLKVTLNDPIVQQYQTSSSGGRPAEAFELDFTKIKMEYTQFSGEDKKPASPKGWDLMKGVAWA